MRCCRQGQWRAHKVLEYHLFLLTRFFDDKNNYNIITCSLREQFFLTATVYTYIHTYIYIYIYIYVCVCVCVCGYV